MDTQFATAAPSANQGNHDDAATEYPQTAATDSLSDEEAFVEYLNPPCPTCKRQRRFVLRICHANYQLSLLILTAVLAKLAWFCCVRIACLVYQDCRPCPWLVVQLGLRCLLVACVGLFLRGMDWPDLQAPGEGCRFHLATMGILWRCAGRRLEAARIGLSANWILLINGCFLARWLLEHGWWWVESLFRYVHRRVWRTGLLRMVRLPRV